MPRVDDALQFLITHLRISLTRDTREGGTYGYDLYLPNVTRAYAREVESMPIQDNSAIERRATEISTVFYEAAWELCRHGVLRPSVKQFRGQSVEEGSGYSITSIGQVRLSEAEHAVFIPTEPSRVADLLNRFRPDFGEGFFQRSQEAVKCHSSNAYLASCVMCGAAAESILLAIASRKAEHNEAEVLALYRTASGRRQVTQLILHNVPATVAASFTELTALLNYWRDDASHGTASDISEFEAYEALARLLRFAHFATDHMTELTA